MNKTVDKKVGVHQLGLGDWIFHYLIWYSKIIAVWYNYGMIAVNYCGKIERSTFSAHGKHTTYCFYLLKNSWEFLGKEFADYIMPILVAVSNSIPVKVSRKNFTSLTFLLLVILLTLGKFVAVISSHVTRVTLNKHGQQLLIFRIHMTKYWECPVSKLINDWTIHIQKKC